MSRYIRPLFLLAFLLLGSSAFAQQEWKTVLYRNGQKVMIMDVSEIDSIVPVVSEGPAIPDTVEYTTPENLEPIDLGLSVKWANLNFGAENPNEQGSYIAWGETSSKEQYDWNTHIYSMGSEYSLTKYCADSYHGYNGFIDNKTTLDPEDDPAQVHWGRHWRTPTMAEMQELIDNCSWTWTSENGIDGCRITSNIEGFEGNSIFLPVTGVIGAGGLEYGYYGNYYTNSTSDSVNGVFLDFGNGWRNLNYAWGRYAGRCFRPVYVP